MRKKVSREDRLNPLSPDFHVKTAWTSEPEETKAHKRAIDEHYRAQEQLKEAERNVVSAKNLVHGTYQNLKHHEALQVEAHRKKRLVDHEKALMLFEQLMYKAI